MKLVKIASNRYKLQMTKSQWEQLGKEAGWISKEAGIMDIFKPKIVPNNMESDFGLSKYLFEQSLKDDYWKEVLKKYNHIKDDKLHLAMAVREIVGQIIRKYAAEIKKFLSNPFVSDESTQDKVVKNLQTMIKSKLVEM